MATPTTLLDQLHKADMLDTPIAISLLKAVGKMETQLPLTLDYAILGSTVLDKELTIFALTLSFSYNDYSNKSRYTAMVNKIFQEFNNYQEGKTLNRGTDANDNIILHIMFTNE